MRLHGLWFAAAVMLLVGCNHHEAEGPDAGPSGAAASASSATLTPAELRARADRAEKLYVAWCGGCHGEHGRGDGPAAAVIVPKPRNFVRDKFKLRSTPSGQPPLRADLLATVKRGLPGTPMPSFAFLTDEERGLIVDYVRGLAGLDKKPEGEAVPVGEEPPATADSIAHGKELYGKLGCGSCHGPEGRGDGQASKTLQNDNGESIPARDYTKGLFMGGDRAADIRMRFLTGMDGTSMPSFAASLPQPNDSWDLAHFLLSLRAPKEAPPSDKVAYGRRIVEEKHCTACHALEGKGGQVGPSLDTIGAKLRYDWAAKFLSDPPAAGKIYFYIPYRMPNLGLSTDEIDALLSLFASLSHRAYPEPPIPAVTLDPQKVDQGKLIYFLKCTECHNMGTVIPTPLAKQQGPDLINVASRLRFEWIPPWVTNPKQFNPDTRMVTTNLKPDEVDAVSAFVWSTSSSAQKQAAPH